jgi:peptidyl-prolyl cis-trans isomerase B (cyclophilin B)
MWRRIRVPTSKQRRETARRRLERQLQRRQELAARRRRRNLVAAAALGVVLVLGAVWLIIARVGGDNTTAASTTPSASTTPASPTPTPKRPPKSTAGPCKYAESNQTLINPNAKDVGLPADPKPTLATGTVPLTVKSNRGTIVITLDRSSAPCAVQSFLYLAGKKFFDNSPCPRVTGAKDGLFVLQCGDPSGTTAGGPTYQYKAEPPKTPYVAGVVAMANSGQPNSTGSQFFVVYQDSKSLPKNYSAVGTVTQGLDVVKKVAAAGNDGSNQAGGGKPKLPITFLTVRAGQ